MTQPVDPAARPGEQSEGPAQMPPEMPPVPRRRLEQAPLPAMKADGVLVVTVGTVLFALATVVLLVAQDSVLARERSWWIGVCAAGTALGVIGIVYCLRLRDRQS